MWSKIKKFVKRHWKNVVIVALCCHAIVDVTAYGNLIYTAYSYFA